MHMEELIAAFILLYLVLRGSSITRLEAVLLALILLTPIAFRVMEEAKR